MRPLLERRTKSHTGHRAGYSKDTSLFAGRQQVWLWQLVEIESDGYGINDGSGGWGLALWQRLSGLRGW